MNRENKCTTARAGACWTDGEVQDLLDHMLQDLTWTQIAGLHLRSTRSVKCRFRWVLNGGVSEKKYYRHRQYTVGDNTVSAAPARFKEVG